MKIKQDIFKYETKGFLQGMENGVLTTVDKKEVEDVIDFNDMMAELAEFCSKNTEKEVVVKFVATASEE